MIISLLLPVAFAARVAAQSESIVCVAGQCLQGVSNTTLGGTLSVPSNPSMLLLPGQYNSSLQPQLLLDMLSSHYASLSLSSGFSNSSTSSSTSTPLLPLTIALNHGILSYPQPLYSGQSTFIPALNHTTITIPPGSFLVAPNTWAAFTSSSTRIIIWDAIPEFAQLPFSSANSVLKLTDIQSAACSPPCSSMGTCSSSGQCICPLNFAGQSCESCASGFFGPSCQPCPSDCAKCDQGLTGSGKCLVPEVSNLPSSCNCLNGVCDGNGCTCNPGWTTDSNGTACATCAPGFFLDANGDCSICQLLCSQCSGGTGDCTVCKSGFTPDKNDPSKCIGNPSQDCPNGHFFDGSNCTACSSECSTCSGSTSKDCITCPPGRYMNNGQCVKADDANGVCLNTTMIADTLKNECDGCPAKCTACNIPNFNNTQTFGLNISRVVCTSCIPGFVLSKGNCVAQCPDGTFLASDNLTCTPCDSSCSTCVGDAKFCQTCNSNLLSINGTCTTSCPSSTFSSEGACLPCHPDCTTCSGGAFDQCNTCPSSRPVLSSGRCLPTCARSEFLDITSSSCKSCDKSCASCIDAGSNACLACADANQVLKSGACVASNCTSSSSIVPGLGVCLSDLVIPDSSSSPLLPIFIPPGTSAGNLAWWQILLLALGCAFVLVLILWLWRRRARKQRAQNTPSFDPQPNHGSWWHRRLHNVLAFFKGNDKHHVRSRMSVKRTEHKWLQLRSDEAVPHVHEISKSGYVKSLKHVPSLQPSIDGLNNSISHSSNRTSTPSLYSQVTGVSLKGPEPKQPLRDLDLERGVLFAPRLSTATSDATIYSSPWDRRPETLPPVLSDVKSYAPVSFDVKGMMDIFLINSKVNFDKMDVPVEQRDHLPDYGEVLKINPKLVEFTGDRPKTTEVVNLILDDNTETLKDVEALGPVDEIAGDGVADPALKEANPVILINTPSFSVSKVIENAISRDDGFPLTVAGVPEGRLILNHLKRPIQYTISRITPEIILQVLYVIVPTPLPLSAIIIMVIYFFFELFVVFSFAWDSLEWEDLVHLERHKSVDEYCVKSFKNRALTRTRTLRETKTQLLLHRSRISQLSAKLRAPFIGLFGKHLFDKSHEETLVGGNLLSYAYLEAGMLEFAAGIISYFIVFGSHGFSPSDLQRAQKVGVFFSIGSPNFINHNGQTIDAVKQVEAITRAQSIMYLGLFIMQFFKVHLVEARFYPFRRRMVSDLYNTLTIFGGIYLGTLIISALRVAPVFDRSFHISSLYWLIPYTFGILLLGWASFQIILLREDMQESRIGIFGASRTP